MVVDVCIRRRIRVSRRAARRGYRRMSTMLVGRCVKAETLDHLREDDPQAIRSRRDLRRINRIMGNRLILDSLLNGSLTRPPLRIAELGAGDGSLFLRLARRRALSWPGVTLILVDRQNLMNVRTRSAFAKLGWTVHAAAMDVFRLVGRRTSSALRRHRRQSLRAPFRNGCCGAFVPRNRPGY